MTEDDKRILDSMNLGLRSEFVTAALRGECTTTESLILETMTRLQPTKKGRAMTRAEALGVVQKFSETVGWIHATALAIRLVRAAAGEAYARGADGTASALRECAERVTAGQPGQPTTPCGTRRET